jgi:hypothetical protein
MHGGRPPGLIVHLVLCIPGTVLRRQTQMHGGERPPFRAHSGGAVSAEGTDDVVPALAIGLFRDVRGRGERFAR